MMHNVRFVYSLEGREKHEARMADLVELFSRRRITDDELLLGDTY